MAAKTQENYQLYKRYVKNIALIYQKRKDLRDYIELLLSISVIIIFSIFAIRPTIITVLGLNRDIDDKKLVVEKLDQKIEALDQAQLIYNQNRSTISLLDTAVPDGAVPEIHARQIEGVAKISNVTLSGMSSSEAQITPLENNSQEESNFPIESEDLAFDVNVSGSYFNVMTFLETLENMRRPTFIEDLNLRLTNFEETEVLMTIRGRVPFMPDL